jgi:hypothetical protein
MLVLGILRLADYVSFRDGESQALARSIGFNTNAAINPDIVYSLDIPVAAAGHLAARVHPLIGIAPMNYPVDPPWNAKEKQTIYASITARLTKFTAIMARRHFSVEFFGTDTRCDPGAIEDLRTRLREDYNIGTPPYESSLLTVCYGKWPSSIM